MLVKDLVGIHLSFLPETGLADCLNGLFVLIAKLRGSLSNSGLLSINLRPFRSELFRSDVGVLRLLNVCIISQLRNFEIVKLHFQSFYLVWV